MLPVKISDIAVTNQGHLKHTNLRNLNIDTIPKFLSTKIFSHSDRQSEKFLTALESLYKDPIIKPIIDVIAVHVLLYDDLAILFVASLSGGHYLSNTNQIKERIAKLPPNEKELLLKIQQIISPSSNDMLEHFKKIEIQSFLSGKDLSSAIVREFTHLVAEIVFNNSSLGYNNPHQKNVYDSSLQSFAQKLVQSYNPRFENDTYSTVNGKELLKIECVKDTIYDYNYNLNLDGKYNKDILKSIKIFEEFAKIFLLPFNFYTDYQILDREIFAKIFESYIKYDSNDWSKKFLGEFKSYFDSVVNPALDQYMKAHDDALKILNIQLNQQNSYGFDISKFTKEWSLSDKLYFAIISNNTAFAKNLIEQGANPSDLFCGMCKPIDVALKLNQYDLVKFMCDNSKNLDLKSLNVYNQTTFDVAQELGEKALSCFKNINTSEIEASTIPLLEQPPELVETQSISESL